MATLTTLARELRQKILLLAVQQVETQLVGTTWPLTITTLLRVCNTLRRDMPWVIGAWSPATRHLLAPSDPASLPPTLTIDGAAGAGGQEAIKRAAHGLAPKKKMEGTADGGRAVRLAPLRKVRWSGRSAKLFGKACGEVGVEAVGEDLRVLAELMVDERRSRLEMPPAGNVHRAMVHSLAQDMGLPTASEGGGQGRYVVVSKKDVGDYESTAVAA